MNPIQMMNKFIEFKNNYKGDPKEEVMNLVRTGQMSQQQLNQLQQMATQFQSFMNNMK